jgi:hypothetical protein
MEGLKMPYQIYDKPTQDGWAMVHLAACFEFATRQGDDGWYGPYLTYNETCNAAANQGHGTLYPCQHCNPLQPRDDEPA